MLLAIRKPVKISLTKDQMLYAAMVGCTRQIDNIFKPGLHNTYGAPRERSFSFHVLGALGECAVAKHYNLYWSGALGDYQATDVGGAQVRTTNYKSGSLITHGRDKDAEPFILVIADGSTFTLCGWLRGRDTKRIEYWREEGEKGARFPAFFAPQGDLEPMEDLHLPWRA